MNDSIRRLSPLALLVAVGLFALLPGCSRKHKVLSPETVGRVTWNNTIFGLMRDRSTQTATVGCMGCHNGGDPAIGDFTEYDIVVADSSLIVSRVGTGGNMRGYLLAGEPETIIAWIHDGAPH